jgi:hypothetical protein
MNAVLDMTGDSYKTHLTKTWLKEEFECYYEWNILFYINHELTENWKLYCDGIIPCVIDFAVI